MKKNIFIDFLSLFSSFSTLFCCAIPALLVGLGAGGVLISLTSSIPYFEFFTLNKIYLFIFAGVMLLISGALKFFNKSSCPIDPVLGRKCGDVKKVSKKIFIFSIALYFIALFFAYFAIYFI